MSDFTTLADQADLYDQSALLERLTHGIAGSEKQLVFVLGSALTAPPAPGERGVCGVDAVIDLIRGEFSKEAQLELGRELAGAENRYQQAFRFLLGRRGPQAPNDVIRRAVASARRNAVARGSGYVLDASTTEEACRGFEIDTAGWELTPGVRALGQLAVAHPQRFGQTVLTTNFDPLIGVSIAVAGGTSFRTIMHRDGNLTLTKGDGAHIVHLHGYWYGSDTLHTPRQLNQPRPQLRSSLSHLLRNQIVVVLAYGGWDDAFTQALIDVVMDDNAYPEVIWCFYEAVPRVRTQLLEMLQPGLDRGRISFYAGVDCHLFLPKLLSAWQSIEKPVVPRRPLPLRPSDSDPVSALTLPQTAVAITQGTSAAQRRPALVNAEEDRPPVLDYYVGRWADLTDLGAAAWRAAYITGIGGQGKSALAATFFESAESKRRFDYRLWRDCKEQSEKFEDQLVTLIEALNNGQVLSSELARQPIEVLADLFCTLTEQLDVLIVFDNVDHYVDLESRMLVGAPGAFLERFLENCSQARLLFTCRPEILSNSTEVYTRRLEGLDLQAARELFRLRGARPSEERLVEVHGVTGGHALWLDLLAAQVGTRKSARLEDLLQRISAGTGEIPDATLRSIWQGLRKRDQVVLQALAETLRPVSRMQLTSFLKPRLNFFETGESLRNLRRQSLLVVKTLDEGEDGFELHPVIRAFIHKTFERAERASFIDAILSFYSAFFGTHLAELSKKPTPATVKRWLEGAELCINAGHYGQAFMRLDEVRAALRRGASPVEYVRVADYLLSTLPTQAWRQHQQFDQVFRTYHRSLVNLGRLEKAIEAIDRYEETLSGKDARYLNLCDMQTYMYWIAGDYIAAIKWGTEGANLKKLSGVDTEFSSDHNLALAQRDSGAIDPALIFFLNGESLDEVLAAKRPDSDRGGAFYGNIGRCLHLMGQVEPALICYAKSAQLIESEGKDSDVENQAYARQWIGELLLAKGEVEAATLFLRAAFEKWRIVSPPKASRVDRTLREIAPNREALAIDGCEEFVLRWIKQGGVD